MSADPNYVLDSAPSNVEPPGDDLPDVATLQAQLDEVNRKLEYESKLREVAENQSAFWFDAANKKVDTQSQQQPQQQAPSLPQQAPELTEDRYNLILSNPAEMQKYVDEVTEYKARIIAREEASQIADQKATQVQGDQRRLQTAWAGEVKRLKEVGITNFGVAGDPMTDAFAQKVQAMMQDPAYNQLDPVIAMKLAIREVEADYLRQGGQVEPEPQQQQQQQQAPAFPRSLLSPQQQQQRDAAIAAQSPSRGRRAASPEKFSNIPPEQMAMLQKHAAGLGVPVEKIIEQMPRVVKFRG